MCMYIYIYIYMYIDVVWLIDSLSLLDPIHPNIAVEECAKVYDWVKQFKRNNAEILQVASSFGCLLERTEY